MLVTNSQNTIWVRGRNVRLRCFEVWRRGASRRISIENRRARTPPSLFGIDRRIV